MSGHRRFRHSLSGRLILIFIGLGALVTLLVGGSIGQALRDHFETSLRPHLRQYMDYVQADIGVPPDYQRAADLSRELGVRIQIRGPRGDWSSSGEMVDLSAMRPLRHFSRAGREYLFGELGSREYLRVVAGGYTYDYSLPRERARWHFAVPLLVLLAVLLLLYHATRRLFAPIQTIKAGVERIGRGDFSHRLNVCRCDELGDLAASINVMAEDVQQLLDSKRQLLLAISHELRSPLTRARVATSLVDDDEQRRDIERELDELEKLVEELLETERLAARHQALERQPVDVGALVSETVEQLRGDRRPLLHLPASAVVAELDPIRIRLLLKNLLENALRHTPADAEPPAVTLDLFAGEIALTVADHGPGIAPEHLPHVTEPFYRADPARRRETGGYGLGLYLCRRIVEVHGGRLEIDSVQGRGTRVRARIPAAGPTQSHE